MGIKVSFSGNGKFKANSDSAVYIYGGDGATFYPSVSESGVLSWTNDKGLKNPDSVSIAGPKGDTGEQGPAGSKGDPGEDGYSPSAKVERTEIGARITITDKDGTTTADVLDGAGGDIDLSDYATQEDLNNLNEKLGKLVGKDVSGETFIVDDESVVAYDGAEIFNDYENNIATGEHSHAEGCYTIATGDYSHAEGDCCIATGYAAHAEGSSAEAHGNYSHAENYGFAYGENSHAEGEENYAFEDADHAEGMYTQAKGGASHTEGDSTVTYGFGAHAEGCGSIAYGGYSHAEGYGTFAYGSESHAEGSRGYYGTRVYITGATNSRTYTLDKAYDIEIGSQIDCIYTNEDDISIHVNSLITDYNPNTLTIKVSKTLNKDMEFSSESADIYTGGTAYGDTSHVEGRGCMAGSENQHVQGRFNIRDDEGAYAHIVGNGEQPYKQPATRSNAHTLDWAGNAWFAGDVYVGSTSGINKDEGSKKLATENYVATTAAPAGFGFGDRMAYVDMTSDAYSGMTFELALESVLATMQSDSAAQVQFYDPHGYHSDKFIGKLWKYTENESTLEATNYSGYKAILRKTGGIWMEWEWENPPLEANVEYRTTERINGKVVFKKADAAGNVVYRLEGESAWVSYVDLIGGNKLIDLTEQIKDSAGQGAIFHKNYIDKDGVAWPGKNTPDAHNSGKTKTNYKRSGFIEVKESDVIIYKNLEGATEFALIALYTDTSETPSSATAVCIDTPVIGKSTAEPLSDELTIKQDGYLRISTTIDSLNNKGASVIIKRRKETATLALKKELSILVIGNSFSQDSFAYLPPVLNEILYDYNITYGIAYTSGASIEDQVRTSFTGTAEQIAEQKKAAVISGGLQYTWFNYWEPTSTKWSRMNIGKSDAKRFRDIMAMRKWDIVYLQPAGTQLDDATIKRNIINPARQILRLVQELNGGPFSLMVGQHLATNATAFTNLSNGMIKAKKWLGVVDTIPIGTAFENARTNETFRDMGEATKQGYTTQGMLYDNHMQAGIPTLIAAYTIALKVLDVIGESHRGIYGSTFIPTTERCKAINVMKDGDDNYFTHGTKCMGVVDEETGEVLVNNIRMAQEYAVLAVNNPGVVTSITEPDAIVIGGTS